MLRLRISNVLYRLAVWINPAVTHGKPRTLCETKEPIISDLPNLVGLPVYFWEVSEATYRMWPIPARTPVICVID